MTETIRLFTALKIPVAVRDQILALPHKGLDSARFNHPDDFHITLRFMGDASLARLPEIEEALARVRVKDFTVVVNGLGLFEKKHHSILYARIESVKKLTHLAAEVTAHLQRTGLDFPPQPYTPHITIARLKNSHGLRDYIEKHHKKIHGRWDADSFILYRSANPDSGGKRYTALKEYHLREF